MPATPASLLARHQAITAQYHDHADVVQEIQTQAIQDLLPMLEEELQWNDEIKGRASAFLEDDVTVFRFSRRARFSPPAALKLLHATLSFRFPSPSVPSPTASLSTLSTTTVHPLYLQSPLFFFHPSLHDKFGRPCAVLNLREVRRTEDGQLGALKDFVRLGWEMGRRWLSELSSREQGVKLQMVVIVDLEGAGMSNLEVELLPFFMDLLKSHFPGMVGAIFVLNYGWMYAGMWQLAKRVLPNTALERILFPNTEELLEFFEEDHLLTEHGGHLSYTYTPSNPILTKFGAPLPTSSADSSHPAPSPSPSSTSLNTEIFHSAPSTRPPTPNPNASHDPPSSAAARPGILTRRPSGLSMTTLKSPSSATSSVTPTPTTPTSSTGLGFSLSNWRRRPPTVEQEQGGGGTSLRRVTSFAELQERLKETQLAIMSDDDDFESELGGEVEQGSPLSFEGEAAAGEGEEEEGGAGALEAEPDRYAASDDEGASSRAPSTAATSARSSRATSRNASRATSREGSPSSLRRRAGGEMGFSSSRAQRFSGTQHLSPYNHSNPYYGYPAFLPSTTLDPSGIPRPHYHRRRKRDLARTLTYLAVLRFLALHRTAKAKLEGLLRGLLRLLRLGGGGGAKEGEKEGRRKVHWEENADGKGHQHTPTKKPPRLTIDQLLPFFLLFLLLRTPNLTSKFRFLLRALFLRLPVRLLSGVVDGVVGMRMRLVGEHGRTRKRDVLRRAVGEAGRRAVEWSEGGGKLVG